MRAMLIHSASTASAVPNGRSRKAGRETPFFRSSTLAWFVRIEGRGGCFSPLAEPLWVREPRHNATPHPFHHNAATATSCKSESDL